MHPLESDKRGCTGSDGCEDEILEDPRDVVDRVHGWGRVVFARHVVGHHQGGVRTGLGLASDLSVGGGGGGEGAEGAGGDQREEAGYKIS